MNAQPTHRRAFLRGAALVPAALLAAPIAAQEIEPETPIRTIFRRYNAALHRHRAMMRATPTGQWIEAAKLSPDREIMNEAKWAMEAEPVTSIEDVALKAVVLTGCFAASDWQLGEECIAFLEDLQ